MLTQTVEAMHVGPVQESKALKSGADSKLLIERVVLIPSGGHQSVPVWEGV